MTCHKCGVMTFSYGLTECDKCKNHPAAGLEFEDVKPEIVLMPPTWRQQIKGILRETEIHYDNLIAAKDKRIAELEAMLMPRQEPEEEL